MYKNVLINCELDTCITMGPHCIVIRMVMKLYFVLAVNLSVALAKACQMKVGLLDADIYGPSIPTMMNLHEKPEVDLGVFSSFLW